jgi:hypothetical protein
MDLETNETPEVIEHDFITGETTARPMTSQEYADYLETIDFIAKNPIT